MPVGHKQKYKLKAAAHMRAAKLPKQQVIDPAGQSFGVKSDMDNAGSDLECTRWTGGVNHICSDSEGCASVEGSEVESDEDVEELDGTDFLGVLKQNLELLPVESQPKAAWETILSKKSDTDWKKAEAQRGLGYNGHAPHTE